jgi:hypothetical protein
MLCIVHSLRVGYSFKCHVANSWQAFRPDRHKYSSFGELLSVLSENNFLRGLIFGHKENIHVRILDRKITVKVLPQPPGYKFGWRSHFILTPFEICDRTIGQWATSPNMYVHTT